MSLDSNIILPFHTDKLASDDPKVREEYMRDLIFSLQRMYEKISQAVNGNIGSDTAVGLRKFTPVVTGTTGTNGAESYSVQKGWYLRQGLIVDVWVDIAFTGHTGTGDTQINLPYSTALTTDAPFDGEMIAGTIAYTANYTQTSWNASSDSLVAIVQESGSGQSIQALPLAAAASFRGHIRYIGKANE